MLSLDLLIGLFHHFREICTVFALFGAVLTEPYH